MYFGAALFFRQPGVPFVSFNPRDWRPLWHPDAAKRIRPTGLAMMWFGMDLFSMGLAVKWLPRWLG